LAGKAEEVDALFARLSDMGPDRDRHGSPTIKRAVGNLLQALWHRVSHENVNETTVHDIAAILDDAAQRIERLK
jgi:hypothetical protein